MSVDFTDYGVEFRAPLLPSPPEEYDKLAFEKFNNSLRLYFNQVDQALRNDTLALQSEATTWFMS
tara:strand:- start:729 stop:923 length:195 start_codon:yes stop_codon:yes gene_type:complete